jgi:glyoxylase-like metal-dependent hydrolase (beta-lactamase superfamily II)
VARFGYGRTCDSEHVDTFRWSVGDAVVFRIGEVDATPALQGLIRGFDPAAVARAGWLTPQFVDGSGRPKGLVQVFVVRLGRTVIVLDPGVGNDKRRVAVPAWTNLHTDLLDRLERAGTKAGQVDYVVNTHLHFDHVGWQTRLVDGAWQPTFPSARHVVSAQEYAYWDSKPEKEIADQHAGFVDSVQPVREAGLLDLVADDHVISDGIRMIPSPGHTPHHVSVLIESRGHSALITGDVLHHPCQIAYPAWGAISDFDPDQALRSRMSVLEQFADSDTLIIGSHFADPVAGRLRRDGPTFRFVPADVERVRE